MKHTTTAEQFLKSKKYPTFNNEGGLGLHYVKEAMVEFAQHHVKQALEAADNNAQVEIVDWEYNEGNITSLLYGVESSSILTAYPLSNIK